MGKHNELYQVVADDDGTHVIFGIQISGCPQKFRISSNRREVEVLAQRFNEYELSPVHFSDAIQDYLRS